MGNLNSQPTRHTPVSIFYLACRSGDIDMVKRMLTTMKLKEINRLESNGSTALHVAVWYGHLEIVELLLKHGCSTTTINKYGKTAVEECRDERIRQVLQSSLVICDNNERRNNQELQELKRENFNLKLRIYFLEEHTESDTNTNECQTQTSYVQQLQNEIERLQQRIQSQSEQTDNRQTVYSFNYDDERCALHEELERIRQENATLRKSFQLNSNKTNDDEQEKLIIKTPAVSHNIQTVTSSIDIDFNTTTPGMSNTFINNSSLQAELNEYKERERKLQEQVNSLQKQLEMSLPQTNETLTELDRARRRLQQYEIDIKNYEQQQSKSERVLQRLQADYEARIATLVEQQQKQTAEFETYRHEHDETSSNINIEEYRQTINDRDRIIQQLEEAINEITIRLRTPFTLMLPSHSSTSQWTDEHSQNLIDELNSQMQAHLETVDQLRAECVELRRSEANLRNQVESLTQLINAPNRNLGLPPLSHQSTSSSKTVDVIEDARQVQDLQTVVVQITLQLQSDAENVSGLTNRVAQMIRDRDEAIWDPGISPNGH
ncbi:unnamed protein product [Rotaria sp. Silwood1]|nr:unnamed protein product [Rotaria sp. Silwood1]